LSTTQRALKPRLVWLGSISSNREAVSEIELADRFSYPLVPFRRQCCASTCEPRQLFLSDSWPCPATCRSCCSRTCRCFAAPAWSLSAEIDAAAAIRFDRRSARLVRHRFGAARQLAAMIVGHGVRLAPDAAGLMRLVHRLAARSCPNFFASACISRTAALRRWI